MPWPCSRSRSADRSLVTSTSTCGTSSLSVSSLMAETSSSQAYLYSPDFTFGSVLTHCARFRMWIVSRSQPSAFFRRSGGSVLLASTDG